MLDLLNGFVVELRNAGLPVSLTENLDAMEAVQHIPIDDREAFKYALGGDAVKNNATGGRSRRCSRCTSACAARSTGSRDGDDRRLDEMWREMQEQMQGEGGRGRRAMDALTPEEIAHLLMQALLNGDQAMMRALARQAVQRFAGMEPGRRSAARTTCTARCATSTSTACSRS
jgi:uncharacterized protein with von Willebrand factor type A (vWA) domain